jgi:hypothetical protein
MHALRVNSLRGAFWWGGLERMPCRRLGWLPSDAISLLVPVLWRGSKRDRHPRIRSARRGVHCLSAEAVGVHDWDRSPQGRILPR